MRSLWALCTLLLLPLAMTMGCLSVFPPKEAVLAGSWMLAATSQEGLSPTTLTFDTQGRLTQVTIQTSSTVQVLPLILSSSTNVDDQDVTIDADMLLFGTLRFNGTLDTDQKVITGKLTTNLNLGLATVIIDNGAATLTKVE